MRIEQNYSLKYHNSFHLPAKTHWFVEYENEDELSRILKDELLFKNRLLSIGEGSNLLFINDFDGVILHSCMKDIAVINETNDSVLLRAGSGVCWDDLVAYAVSEGWGGIENLSKIPGEVGAAAVQNIGAYGVEIRDVVETVEGYHQLTGVKRVFTNELCHYAYRSSCFKDSDHEPYIITSIGLRLQKNPQFKLDYGNLSSMLRGSVITLQAVRDAIITVRRSKLPETETLGNAGSFFVNPVIPRKQFEDLKERFPLIPYYPEPARGAVKIPAGWLIEQCGFKGKREGHVGVYEKQALIIVNHGGATGEEIVVFARKIRNAVNDVFGIQLVPEVKYVV